jgi:peptidoglycan hydrolase-like protein with peptidoglycan-binding domain
VREKVKGEEIKGTRKGESLGMQEQTNLEQILIPASFATSGPTLRPWSSGPTVVELQELLKAHGFKLAVTGEFDSYTEDCVLIFQKRHGLRVDAIVGTQTWQVLKTTVKPGTRSLRRGLCGADVYELQGLLQVNGYPIQRDGLFGYETRHAVTDFQQRYKLRETGQVDQSTWAMLYGNKK